MCESEPYCRAVSSIIKTNNERWSIENIVAVATPGRPNCLCNADIVPAPAAFDIHDGSYRRRVMAYDTDLLELGIDKGDQSLNRASRWLRQSLTPSWQNSQWIRSSSHIGFKC